MGIMSPESVVNYLSKSGDTMSYGEKTAQIDR